LVAGDTKLGGSVSVGAAGEEVGDLIMGGKKPLHLPRRLETFHDPISALRLDASLFEPAPKRRKGQMDGLH
jgi:hypothetical protein